MNGGKRPAAVQQPEPVTDSDADEIKAEETAATLTLELLWAGLPVSLGRLDPRLHQIALRGELAVAPAVDPPGLSVIDARRRVEVRRIVAPNPREEREQSAPLGVALDGDYAVFATAGGFVAKVSLDGSYQWVTRERQRVMSAPLLVELDGDGVLDAVYAVEGEGSVCALSGVSGSLLWKAGRPCTEPKLHAVTRDKQGFVVLECAERSDGFEVLDASGEARGATFLLTFWPSPVLRGLAIDAPDRPTCFLNEEGACWRVGSSFDRLLRGGTGPWQRPANLAAASGAFFDGERYGAITVAATGAKILVVDHEQDGDPRVRTATLVEVDGSPTLELNQVTTVSSGDLNGDGRWDLLVATNDGQLRAYATQGRGRLYQGLPHGDLANSGVPPDTWQTIETYASASETAARFGPSKAKSEEPFVSDTRPWKTLPRSERSTLAAVFEPALARRPLVATWSAGAENIPVEQRPLLRHAQASRLGLFAHDGRTLWRRASDERRWSISEPQVRGGIDALALTEDEILVASGGKLHVSRGIESKLQRSELAAHVLASDSARGTVWVGTQDGQLFRYDPSTGQRAQQRSMERVGTPGALCVADGVVFASGPKGTLAFKESPSNKSDPAFVPVELQEVVRCSTDAPFYARSHGALLEAPGSLAAWTRVRGQPSAIRAITCDRDGGLLVLSADQGVLGLRGPVAPAPWWQWALLLGTCLGALGWQVLQSFRARMRRKADDEKPSVKVGLRTDLPLSRLPPDPKTHVRLRNLVKALVRFIDNEDTFPPITLGIYGPWGSGKSSVMRSLQHELEQKRRYLCVWFNPWRFHREPDIAAALLQSVVSEVRALAGLGRLRVLAAGLLSTRTLITLSWLVPLLALSIHMACWPESWSWLPLGDVLHAFDLVDVQKGLAEVKRDVAGVTGTSVLTIGTLGALGRVVMRLVKVFKLNPSDLLGEDNQEKRVNFIRHFSDELRTVVDALPHAQRVVVFVDDLDRCPPEQVVAMLEALNQLTESQRCYFVLGMDPRMITCAVELQYQELLELKERRGESVRGFGASYLEKIVTLAVHVPEVTAAELEEAERAAQRLREQTPAQGSRLERFTAFCTLHTTQLALAGWVTLWAIGIGSLLWTADPDPESETAAAADKPAGSDEGAGQTSSEGAGAPGTAKSADDERAAAATDTKETAPRGANDEAGPKEGSTEQAELPLTRPLTQAALALPVEPPRRIDTVSPSPADQAHARSVRKLWLAWVFGALVGTSVLCLALLIWLRRRQLGEVEPAAKDSEAFKTTLECYLAHLPANPRRLIRQGNAARFLYYLELDTLVREKAGAQEFFAALLAEQLRPIFGDEVPFEERLAGVLNRSVPTSTKTEQQARVKELISRWPPAPAFTGSRAPPAILVRELQGWLRDTTA